MGLNDTDKLGLKRPIDGETDWGTGDDDSLNFNFELLEEVLLPSGGSTHQIRYVAKSFVGLSLPVTGAKIFGTINDAIADITPGNNYPDVVVVYPGVYNEEILITDRSVIIHGLTNAHNSSYAADSVVISSNANSATATGRACVSVNLRSGEDEAHPDGQDLWDLSYNQHETRTYTKIVFNNIFFDNYGKYYLDEPHDTDTAYYLDCTDGGTPPYYGNYTWIVFNNCLFRGQVWWAYNRGYEGDLSHLTSWYQYGFRLKAYSTYIRFMDCNLGFMNYGRGNYGKNGFFCGFMQPFYCGTDGTSFISWYAGAPGTTLEFERYSGNEYQEYPSGGYIRPYNIHRSSMRMMRSDVNVIEYYGNFVPNPPYDSLYDGIGWVYGHGADSSNAIFTTENMGHIYIRASVLKPSVWGDEADYGPDPSDDSIENSNWINIYTNPGDPAAVYGEGKLDPSSPDTPHCTSSAFNAEGAYRFGSESVLLNVYQNLLGGQSIRSL